jgi:dipeptidyl aminopeptidase/acylaminoacyl peptidase
VGSIGVDGGDEQYRSLDVQVGEIAWAPAGWPLIYVPSSRIAGLEGKHVGPDPDLWRLDNLYGEPRKLIESRANEFDPLFSPDGTEIAFMRERKSSSSLWKVSAEGSNPQQLTGNLFGPSSAAWSPDGRWITFSTYDGEIRNVRPNAPDYRRSRDFPARRYKD